MAGGLRSLFLFVVLLISNAFGQHGCAGGPNRDIKIGDGGWVCIVVNGRYAAFKVEVDKYTKLIIPKGILLSISLHVKYVFYVFQWRCTNSSTICLIMR